MDDTIYHDYTEAQLKKLIEIACEHNFNVDGSLDDSKIIKQMIDFVTPILEKEVEGKNVKSKTKNKKVNTGRQASPTLRGYVYQIDYQIYVMLSEDFIKIKQEGREDVDVITKNGHSSRQLKYNFNSNGDSLSLTSDFYTCIKDTNRSINEIIYICAKPQTLMRFFGQGLDYVYKYTNLLASKKCSLQITKTKKEIDNLYNHYKPKERFTKEYLSKISIEQTQEQHELYQNALEIIKKELGYDDVKTFYLYFSIYELIRNKIFSDDKWITKDEYQELILEINNSLIGTSDMVNLFKECETNNILNLNHIYSIMATNKLLYQRKVLDFIFEYRKKLTDKKLKTFNEYLHEHLINKLRSLNLTDSKFIEKYDNLRFFVITRKKDNCHRSCCDILEIID